MYITAVYTYEIMLHFFSSMRHQQAGYSSVSRQCHTCRVLGMTNSYTSVFQVNFCKRRGDSFFVLELTLRWSAFCYIQVLLLPPGRGNRACTTTGTRSQGHSDV